MGNSASSRTASQDAGDQETLVRDRLFDLRDYFAGQALCGDLAGQHAGVASDEDADFIAQRAYEFADAMLKHRRTNKPPSTTAVDPSAPDPGTPTPREPKASSSPKHRPRGGW